MPWKGHLPLLLGCGVRGPPGGLQAEKEAVAPSPHQVAEVRVGFGWGRGPGLPEREEISDAAQ